MTLTSAQAAALAHLRAAYVGPEGGPKEVTLNQPSLQYAVGMLHPLQLGSDRAEGEARTDAVSLSVEADVDEGELEEQAADVPLAEDWRPSSVAVSFVTEAQSISVDLECGTYARVPGDGPPRWRRTPHELRDKVLTRAEGPLRETLGGVPVQIGSRWRLVGRAWLVTVHVRVLARSTGEAREDNALMLFQVALAVRPGAGGRFLEYDTTRAFDPDPEAAEIRLRYRDRKVYAVGHGMASDWVLEAGRCTQVSLEPVPAFVVPAIETRGFDEGSPEAASLDLSHLARVTDRPDAVLATLDAFVAAFSAWTAEQRDRVADFGPDSRVAARIVERCEAAMNRMAGGVNALRDERVPHIRKAFSLGMLAMEHQMRQSRRKEVRPDAPVRWRPFQLGFLLLSLASTMDPAHEDREAVDLIWFPTGGGKTEAYLGLAAIEIFRRRLTHGPAGGGTAVITRYTLRLLTAQQFQRAAALICAMELMRREHPDVQGMTPFSIGLWVGNEVTPGNHKAARDSLDKLHKSVRPEEAFTFQVDSCPWCGTRLVPEQRDHPSAYGVRRDGNVVVLRCVREECAFSERLPLEVVDEALYEDPPTILLATVDKFARLQFAPRAGRLLGLGTTFIQPSLVIQDELHLLSGPLGTTVAVFDAVVQVLLGQQGSQPKIVASTATIRASAEQVQGLYGRQVKLYPPAGLDDDRTFFSSPVAAGEGRLYVGLMPQSMPQATAVVSATAPMLELPFATVDPADPDAAKAHRDDYWTVVMYHNSLRELGRSNALLVDDVHGRLAVRAARLGLPGRPLRGDRVMELTSRRSAEELPRDLRSLQVKVGESVSCVDVVLSSNMLSVGIDIPRLAVMLMVGQPKTVAEYIQATSRVGRGTVRGLVITLFRSNRARDRSHFETFRGFHEALYRNVEPTSVTPWSLASRERTLAGALVALLRQSIAPLSDNAGAVALDLDSDPIRQAIELRVAKLLAVVRRAEPHEADETEKQVWGLLREWDRRAAAARRDESHLVYEQRGADTSQFMVKRFGQDGQGWLVGDSMRSVDPAVAISVQEPFQEVERG